MSLFKELLGAWLKVAAISTVSFLIFVCAPFGFFWGVAQLVRAMQ